MGIATTYSPEQARVINQRLCEGFTQDGGSNEFKEAKAELSDFCRTYVREEPFNRKIWKEETVTDKDLVPQQGSEANVVILEREPATPVAVKLAYQAPEPKGVALAMERTTLEFFRIASARFYKDVALLRTYKTDIRQVMSDNSVAQIGTVEDETFIAACQLCVGSTPGATAPATNFVQYERYASFDRNSFAMSLNLLPKSQYKIPCQLMLINFLTQNHLIKWNLIEWGGTKAGEMMMNGWTSDELAGKKLISTIKHELVPTLYFWQFGPADMFGRYAEIVEPTMYVEKRYWFVDFMIAEEMGGTIEHPGAVGLARFDA